jgi:tripartite-type tricarboxylate transporter receptor subunit TctC
MKLQSLIGVVALASFTLASPFVRAQDFKAPIRLIVPFAAGGATDVVARLIGPKISASLGQPVVVDNRAGASGQIGTQAAQQAKSDGATFVMGADQSLLVVPLITPNVPYDGVRDFVAVGMISKFRWAFSTSAVTGARTLDEFTDYVRTNPERRNFGVPSLGGMPQMVGNAVGKKVGFSLVVAPYNGASPMMSDLMGGQIAAGVSGLTEALSLQRSGRGRILAVSGEKRSAVAPEVPTLAEIGVPGLEVKNWFGIFAPKGLPESMQLRFNSALNDALKDPAITQKVEDLAMELFPTTLEEAKAEVMASDAFWKKMVATPGSGVKP